MAGSLKKGSDVLRVGLYAHGFQKNKVFEKNKLGENLEFSMILLRDRLKEKGIELCTLDMYPAASFAKVIFMDVPVDAALPIRLKALGVEVYLQIAESQIVYKQNWIKDLHAVYKKILVWHDAWVDHQRYVKYYLPNKIPSDLNFDLAEKQKLCTLIASNRYERDARELYSKRLEAIQWFEKHQPQDFDFFGYGWDCYKFKGRITRVFNRIPLMRQLFAPNYRTYGGTVSSKNQVLRRYKFSICYENAKDIPGYITEKIFDCFFAGCVPVYWGAPNVADFIPENTFIDKRNFESYAALYTFMKNMDDKTYSHYLTHIRQFLQSEAGYKFSAEHYVETIFNEVLGDEDLVRQRT